jgi:hypothetical protein
MQMSWAEHAARIREIKNSNNLLVVKPEVEDLTSLIYG